MNYNIVRHMFNLYLNEDVFPLDFMYHTFVYIV